MKSTHLTFYIVVLLFFICCQLDPISCASIGDVVDLESRIDLTPYSDSENDNNNDSGSDSGSGSNSGSGSDGIVESTRSTQELETEQAEQIVLSQPGTVPLAQHLASLPIWVSILYLGYFIHSDSIVIWALNCFHFIVLAVLLQVFSGSYLTINLSNFPCILETERINFNLGGRTVELSRWALVPFAWLTEIAIIIVNGNIFIDPSLSNFSSVSILMFIFIAQLFYIYSFPLFSVQTA